MTPLTRSYLKRAGLAWSILCAVGAMAGGIYGLIARESDDA